MRIIIILLVLVAMGCNQISGADEIQFPDENDTGSAAPEDAGVDAG